jgi:hypothetical protein
MDPSSTEGERMIEKGWAKRTKPKRGRIFAALLSFKKDMAEETKFAWQLVMQLFGSMTR